MTLAQATFISTCTPTMIGYEVGAVDVAARTIVTADGAVFAVLVTVDLAWWHVVALGTVAVLQDDDRVSLLTGLDTATTVSNSLASLGVTRFVRVFAVTFVAVQILTWVERHKC